MFTCDRFGCVANHFTLALGKDPCRGQSRCAACKKMAKWAFIRVVFSDKLSQSEHMHCEWCLSLTPEANPRTGAGSGYGN